MDDIEKRRDEVGDEPATGLYDQGLGALGNEPAPLVEGDEADAPGGGGLGDDELSYDRPDEGLEPFDEEDGLDLGGPAAPAWVATVTGAALGLAVVQALVLFGTVAQGMAVERFDGDFFHKVGVAMLSNVGSANGLMLLMAAVLAGLPALLGFGIGEQHRRRAALTFTLVAVLAVLVIVGTPMAVRARVRVLDLQQQAVDNLARRVLATYVAGTLGSALVALGTALGLARLNRRR